MNGDLLSGRLNVEVDLVSGMVDEKYMRGDDQLPEHVVDSFIEENLIGLVELGERMQLPDLEMGLSTLVEIYIGKDVILESDGYDLLLSVVLYLDVESLVVLQHVLVLARVVQYCLAHVDIGLAEHSLDMASLSTQVPNYVRSREVHLLHHLFLVLVHLTHYTLFIPAIHPHCRKTHTSAIPTSTLQTLLHLIHHLHQNTHHLSIHVHHYIFHEYLHLSIILLYPFLSFISFLLLF